MTNKPTMVFEVSEDYWKWLCDTCIANSEDREFLSRRSATNGSGLLHWSGSSYCVPTLWGRNCEKDDLLVLTIQPHNATPLLYSTENIDDLDAHIQERIRVHSNEESKRNAVRFVIENILHNFSVDWSISPIEPFWQDWLISGAGKIIETTAFPRPLLVDSELFWDYVYNLYIPVELGVLGPIDFSKEDSLKLLLVLEIVAEGKGECLLYKMLRDNCGVPYDWNNLTLTPQIIKHIVVQGSI